METNFISIAIAGLIGGVVNCILVSKGFVKPTKHEQDGRTIYDIGFWGDIILGVAASIVVYCLGVDEITSQPKILGICFLSGIGGSNLIKNILQQQKIKIQQEEIFLGKSKLNSTTQNFAEVLKEMSEYLKLLTNKKKANSNQDEND